MGLHFQNTPVPYKLPAVQVRTHQIREMLFRSSHLRTPGRLENTFCNECFVDELAAAAGVDPRAWRRGRLDDPRALAVIDATAKLAVWEARPAGERKTNDRVERGRGFAYVRYNDRQGPTLRRSRRSQSIARRVRSRASECPSGMTAGR